MDDPVGRTGFPLRLRLLDRQVRDRDGCLIAKVDDLELEPGDPSGPQGPRVTALLTGPMALGPRIGGRIGRWMTAVARRFAGGREPGPHRIGMARVAGFDSAVTLVDRSGRPDVAPLEDWLRTRFVERIPGSRHAGE